MALHSADDIRRVANLARLTISDEDVGRLQDQLGKILHYVERLDEVETSQVAPMVHAIELTDVFRADEPAASLPREQALANAPRSDGACFLVPAILEESE
jgi:aspartyl-tRNA(Asn)/glutamyl-tRNA(Gln) amidotransferase subunit C